MQILSVRVYKTLGKKIKIVSAGKNNVLSGGSYDIVVPYKVENLQSPEGMPSAEHFVPSSVYENNYDTIVTTEYFYCEMRNILQHVILFNL